ncbi:MAG TPA: TetR/AcrR family transcriptional regulator [Nocardioidaceae bacterium]|nr:TetR/AcrR family transcriptional regulator [Nocardioidaceae bacterium]
MPMEAGSRPRARRMPRGARRAQLLEAALEVFVASGYHAAGMDDIAERAGVSKPVLYQHFPSKLDLYLALLDAACDSVIAGVRAALSSTDVNKERVAGTTDAFYTYVTDADGAFRLVFESDLTSEPAVRERVDRVTMACADAIAEVIAEDTGFAPEKARLLAAALVGMSHVSARFWLSTRGELPQSQAVDLISTLAWRGLGGFPRQG